MRIRKMVSSVKTIDIGTMDFVERLPMSGRKRYKMKSPCSACRQQIEDDFMVIGIKEGHKNMMFHDACIDAEMRLMADARDAIKAVAKLEANNA